MIRELRRVLAPDGVLLFGAEMGGRSAVIDFYYERARAMGVLRPRIGASTLTQTLAALRKPGHGSARTEAVEAPFLTWTRTMPIEKTLDALASRTFSQMWDVPEEAHGKLLAETTEYARREFGLAGVETRQARFALHAVRWP